MRRSKHDRYYKIPGYQIIARKSDSDVAEFLGMSIRTYKDKIDGRSDFTTTQGALLSELLGVSQSELFSTSKCTE